MVMRRNEPELSSGHEVTFTAAASMRERAPLPRADLPTAGRHGMDGQAVPTIIVDTFQMRLGGSDATRQPCRLPIVRLPGLSAGC